MKRQTSLKATFLTLAFLSGTAVALETVDDLVCWADDNGVTVLWNWVTSSSGGTSLYGGISNSSGEITEHAVFDSSGNLVDNEYFPDPMPYHDWEDYIGVPKAGCLLPDDCLPLSMDTLAEGAVMPIKYSLIAIGMIATSAAIQSEAGFTNIGSQPELTTMRQLSTMARESRENFKKLMASIMEVSPIDHEREGRVREALAGHPDESLQELDSQFRCSRAVCALSFTPTDGGNGIEQFVSIRNYLATTLDFDDLLVIHTLPATRSDSQSHIYFVRRPILGYLNRAESK